MIYFNSWDSDCKAPFGALQCHCSVKFHIKCDGFSDGYIIFNDEYIKMTPSVDGFVVSKAFDEPGIIFYNFMLISDKGIKVFVNKDFGGTAAYSLYKETSFQLTVYSSGSKTPTWYKEGIAYQIFPDRFCIGEWINREKDNVHYYDDWFETPKYIKQNNEIKKWDFFGGNIRGIVEKLPYLKELNISVIYLNPIFEANSNHRYNTGNYMKIDPILGTEGDFDYLIKKAGEYGIKIILDGVFNHTGADSLYFNKFGSYPDTGAYQSKDSKYYPWFYFDEFPDKYQSWWGVMDLPRVNSDNEDYRKFIMEGPVKKWTQKGIGGWRLDVADELSDDFLELLYKNVKKINPDSVIMGEVWEDASNKVSYGKLKSYFTNSELDSVMNYPLRNLLIDYVSGNITAFEIVNSLTSIMENYPYERFMGNFNFLGTHDVERILTVISGFDEKNKLKILSILVMCLFVSPGIPCIYYGDEAGLTGGKDPDNRKTYPWGRENKEVFKIYKNASDERNKNNSLKLGKTKYVNYDNVFGIIRFTDFEKSMLFVNPDNFETSFYCKELQKTITLKPFGYSFIK